MDQNDQRQSGRKAPHALGQPSPKDKRNAIGGQRPPLNGEVSPHEQPTPDAQAAVKRGS